MNRLKIGLAALAISLPLFSCVGYNAFQKAKAAEKTKDWDNAVLAYEKALETDPENSRFKIDLQRARLEASRVHFEKGKSLRTAAANSTDPSEKLRLSQMAATELKLTVKLDTTNQFAAVELGKAIAMINDLRAANDKGSIEDVKKRAARNITKAQPPVLNPASDAPISLSFPRETPVKDIYRALGNAFGINVLFDQAVKDDRIAIELKDVTAQQALERVMQAANHFYKVLDEHTIIVVPDNPQARRDYEDLVIRTFYLSNGDAEQVTNVVRTMIEARNVFPLKALNAITIRDTADKVRIAEKIIEANDKAKAEVVVDVELLQLNMDKTRNIGMAIQGTSGTLAPFTVDAKGVRTPLSSGTISDLKGLGSIADGNFSFTIPSATYALVKSVGEAQLLANPELRISEGEKATLHIGSRIPVPVSTFQSTVAGTTGGTVAPVTSFQYQDVGIKVSMEPRVHHNREVTLKLTVEVSDLGNPVKAEGQPDQPTFNTRTIESTIRLKDGETNFLAGLIQENETKSDAKTPFLGDIPVLGRLFTQSNKRTIRTDLVMTMTPHIIRIPDITEDDLAPMWVGTTNNLTFRGVSPRIESQIGADPFIYRSSGQFATGSDPNAGLQLSSDGEPGNYIRPDQNNPQAPPPPTVPPGPKGLAPTDPFKQPTPTPTPSEPESALTPPAGTGPTNKFAVAAASVKTTTEEVDQNALSLSPRISPQPVNLFIRPGEQKSWSLVGLDLDNLSTEQLVMHYDSRTLQVNDVAFGPALAIDPTAPPVVTVDRDGGTVKVVSSNGKPLTFTGGGNILALHVQGGPIAGETFLVVDNPNLKNGKGAVVMSAVSGGRARIE